MAAPVISSSSSILGFRRNESFAFQLAATNDPVRWSAVGLPPGVTIETHAEQACTIEADDDAVTCAAHGFADGDRIHFPTLTGGSGLTANTVIYYVRDKATDTFKVAATPGGAAINVATDATAGTVRKISSGLISGACATAGVYVATVSAINAAGETGTREFVFGISSEASAAADASAAFDAIALEIQLPSGTVRLAGSGAAGAAEAALFDLKQGDKRMLVLRFVDADGNRLDPDPATLKFALKELDPETVLITASDFEKTGSDDTAEFWLPVDVSGAALAGALSNYEADGGTLFAALAEFEWTRSVTFDASPLTLKASTPTFAVQVSRDLVPDA